MAVVPSVESVAPLVRLWFSGGDAVVTVLLKVVLAVVLGPLEIASLEPVRSVDCDWPGVFSNRNESYLRWSGPNERNR